MAVPDARTERLAAHARRAVAQLRWTPAPSSPREAPGACRARWAARRALHAPWWRDEGRPRD